MAVWLAYHTGSFSPENAPKAFMFAAPNPIVDLRSELAGLCPGGLSVDITDIATVRLFDAPTGNYADCSFNGHPVHVKGSGRGNSFAVSADNAGVPVFLIFRPQGVPAHEAGFHAALIGAADATAAVVAAKALAGGGYPDSFEGYRVVQVGVASATNFKNTVFEGDAVEFYGLTPGGDQPARMVPNAQALGVAAGTKTYALTPSGGRKGVAKEFFEPANVLLAPNIVIIGASIEEYSFGNAVQGSAALKQHVVDLAARLGFKGTVQGRGVASQVMSQILTTAIAAKAEFIATQGQNVYIAHTGGNDVTNRRPYTTPDQAFFNTGLQALYDVLTAGGDQVIFTNLSKRLYVSAPAQAGLPTADTQGSLPYNDASFHPFIKAKMPQWWDFKADRPSLDFYKFVERHEDRWSTVSDGIHPHVGTYASVPQFYLGRLWAKANGVVNVPGQRSGRSFIFVPRSSGTTYPIYTSNLNYVRPDGQSQPQQGKGVMVGAFDLLGNYDPFIEFSTNGFTGVNTGGGSGSGAHARIADTRLQLGAILSDSMFADQTSITPAIRWAGLQPGETGIVSIVSSRALADSIRRCTWSMNAGNPLLHDSATNAASNVTSWPFTVPASGILDLTGAVAVGGGITGYLSAAMIEFN